MYIDASLNSVSTIVANLYQSFHEAAVRCLEYVRVLSKVRATCSGLLISTFPLPKALNARPKRKGTRDLVQSEMELRQSCSDGTGAWLIMTKFY
jgi:hypothetical protein